jgi:hypothetical protein
MNKFKIVFFILSLFSKSLYSQVIPQTGSATFGLPVFNWSDDRSRLSSSLSINYNSGNGLKVADVASNLGQGWSLICGGVITRMQIGEPDDQVPKDGSIDDINKYPPGYLYNDIDPTSGCHVRLAQYPIFRDQNRLYKQMNNVAGDKELDRFMFQFNGRSGIFVLDKRRENNIGRGFMLGDSKIKIEYHIGQITDPTIRNSISSFIITDENGIRYTFSILEKTRVKKVKFTDKTGNFELQAPEFPTNSVNYQSSFDTPVESYVVNSWHLEQVEEPLTRRKIFYNYTTRSITSTADYTITLNRHPISSLLQNPREYVILSENKTKAIIPFIANITYPDGYMVAFNYSTNQERYDLKGDYPLNSIDVKLNDRFLSKYLFTSSYFIGNRIGKPISDNQKNMARLCLTSIQKVNSDLKSIDPPYLFDYYKGNGGDDIVPSPNTLIKDIWGFYNGNYSKDFNGATFNIYQQSKDLPFIALKGLCFLRDNSNAVSLNAKPGFAQNGLLKKITYPLGGGLIYEYSQNKAKLNGSIENVGGVHVSQIKVFSGGFNFECIDNAVITNYNYISDNNTDPSLWGVEMPVNKILVSNQYEPQGKYYTWGLSGGCFPLGCCKYRFKFPGIESIENAVDVKGVNIVMELVTMALDAFSAVSTVIDVISVIGGGNAVTLGITIFFGIVNIILSCFTSQETSSSVAQYFNFDLNTNNPLPVQFKRVVVTESSGDNIGRTEMIFTSNDDYPIWEPQNNLYSAKQRYASWAYGLPKSISIFDKDNHIIKQTLNRYNSIYIGNDFSEVYENGVPVSVQTDFPSCKCFVKRSTALRSDHWQVVNTNASDFVQDANSNPDLLAEKYSFKTGRLELATTIEKEFKLNGEVLETQKQFTYNKCYLPSRITTRQSDGKVSFNINLYSGDTYIYTSNQSNLLKSLINNNILTLPITSVEGFYEGNKAYLLQENVSRYMETPDGDIKSFIKYVHRTNEPIELTSNSNHLYEGDLSASNPPYDEVQRISYNYLGKPINVKDEAGRQVSSIYDYNDKLMVASIINADQIEQKENSAYTSFETSSLGGWFLNGNAIYDNRSITGKRSFQLTNGNELWAKVNHPKPYIISFWAINNSISIDNGNHIAVLKKSTPTINGFTYYEYEVPSIDKEIKITGQTFIDELRLYPVAARMRTTTYDEILGKTSECDENNRITYFEYDDNGRLRFIKDEKQNVIKMYEYNTSQFTNNTNCPNNIVYSNVAMSEFFRKNDCPKDYEGTEVLYSVQAGTFTSGISQEYVDQQASDLLNLEGQANANANGICLKQFFNREKSETFRKEGCDIGYIGDPVIYTVPANRYISTISQDAANYLAQIEINANGQAYANMPTIGTCSITTEPIYEGTGQERCNNDPASPYYQHKEYEVINVNPNSTPFPGPTQWVPGELSADCGAVIPPPINISYSNLSNSPALVSMKRLDNNQLFTFTIPANSSSTAGLISVMPGNYLVSINLPMGNSTNSISFYSTTQSGSSFFMSSLPVINVNNSIITINN